MQRLLAPSAFAFCGVMYREIVMDLNDAEGDGAAGIKTLPVRLGKPRALLVALALMLAGACAALGCLASNGLAGWVTGLLGRAGGWAAAGATLALAAGQVAGQAAAVWRSGFDRAAVGRAVDQCLKPIGLGMIAVATMA
jgi:4-hydroxybenzoate polyprenyltransferase